MPMRQLAICVLLTCAASVAAADEKPAVNLDRAAVHKLVEQLANKDVTTHEDAIASSNDHDGTNGAVR